MWVVRESPGPPSPTSTSSVITRPRASRVKRVVAVSVRRCATRPWASYVYAVVNLAAGDAYEVTWPCASYVQRVVWSPTVEATIRPASSSSSTRTSRCGASPSITRVVRVVHRVPSTTCS